METTMHYFDTELAAKYGMVEATILNHLQYWIQKNAENNKNYHEGRYWTFNSIQSFCKLFPYLTAKKIRNAIKKLEDAKVLMKGNFNKFKYDRTTWYAFTDLGLRLFSKKEDKKTETEKPEKSSNTDIDCLAKQEKTAEQDNAISEKESSTKKNIMQIPPKAEDVQAYCAERNSCINVQRFMAYYTANGWYFGKRKMKKTKDWQAAVRYWEQTEKSVVNVGNNGKIAQNRFCNFQGREWDYDELQRLEQELQNGGW